MKFEYDKLFPSIENASQELEVYLRKFLSDVSRIDRIGTRSKGIEKFKRKCRNVTSDGELKYPEPLAQIQDQIGARVIVFFLSDVEKISTLIKENFTITESAVKEPESTSEFSYFGHHYICMMPTEISGNYSDSYCPDWFELQIKTMHQHAWSEAGHDIGYKPSEFALSSKEERKMAYASALSWGADRAFDDLHKSTSTN